jgi:hypothetical protein
MWEGEEPSDDRPIEVLSSTYSDDAVKRLSFESLAAELTGSSSVSIASAYYDKRFFKRFFQAGKATERLDSVRIVVNGLRGRRLNEQLSELSRIAKDLSSRCGDVEVRLVFGEAIFHPKLFLFSKPDESVALVGSANATEAAMTLNEEILVRISEGTEPLQRYFDRIWETAQRLGEQEYTAKTLVNFFRTGVIFFRQQTALQMTVNPFSELLKALPRQERQQLTTAAVRYSEPQAGIGPFNLRAALNVDDETTDQAEEKTHRVSVRPHAVETCFGYWVPYSLVDALNQKLDARGAATKSRLTEFHTALDSKTDAELGEQYSQYLEDARRALELLPSVARIIRELKMDPLRSIKPLESKLRALRASLANEDYRNRLSRPFIDTPMPEIWDDPVARTDFETSFFEYLAYVSRLPSSPKVAGRILRAAGVPLREAWSEAEIKAGFEAHLRSKGWHPRNDWTKREPRIRAETS